MKRVSTLLLLLLVVQFTFGQYEPKTKGELVKHTHYTLDYNEPHEQANWVYYHLLPSNINGGVKRTNSFRPDPKVSTQSATTADYTKSGYDRGHLCPAADMSHTEEAMRESFYMSNMSPQAPMLNRGKWKTLEEAVRRWCLAKGELHITVGGVLKDGLPQIGANKVSVPEQYYKAIYSPRTGEMIAFLMPNTKLEESIEHFAVTVDEVEAIIGIDLFPQADQSLESKINLSKWGF
ncbi:MAG: DNA/RNA non-specific endonuclease [Rikenellaceae bacterium]